MRMGRIGGFEACTFVGVVGNRIGPLRGFVLGGKDGGLGGWVMCVCCSGFRGMSTLLRSTYVTVGNSNFCPHK